MREAEQRTAGPPGALRLATAGPAKFSADEVRLTRAELDRPVGRGGPAAEDGPGGKPAVRRERRMPAAHTSFSTAGTAGSELADTNTGSGRIVSWTRLPAGSADASAVVSWAMIEVSPRSTVT